MDCPSAATRSTSPPAPKPGTGAPVAASSAMRRQRELRKIRRERPSLHAATPRWTKPVPFGTWPASVARGSNAQSCRPVRASRATTRLYGVLRYIVSRMTMGVAWKLPGRVPFSRMGTSPVSHVHAGASRPTLARLICASGEYFIPPGSPPYAGQSPERGGAGASRAARARVGAGRARRGENGEACDRERDEKHRTHARHATAHHALPSAGSRPARARQRRRGRTGRPHHPASRTPPAGAP